MHLSKFLTLFNNDLALDIKNTEFFSKIFTKENKKKNKQILIAPSSGLIENHKRYPISNWTELIKNIMSLYKNYKVFLIGTMSEKKLLQKISFNTGSQIQYLKNPLQTINLIQNSALYISGDCGTSHLASLTTTHMILIWGPTNKLKNGPMSPYSHYIDLKLPCSPCAYRSGCGDNICMKNIKSGLILKKIDKLLNYNLT